MSNIKAMAAEMKAEQPPLLPNTPLYPIYATPTIKKSTDRPTQTYLDVTFMDKKPDGIAVTEIDALIFKNFYTASITISTLVDKADGIYVPVLENRIIMPSPYYENNSQIWVTICVSEFNSNYVPGKPLRFTLIQPSPVWKDYDIRHMCAVGKAPNSEQAELVADGGISATAEADVLAAWKNRSLSSLIKADTMFLTNKSSLLLEQVQREDNIKAILLKGQKSATVPAVGKTKMAKKKGDPKKTGGLSLPGGGGTRKEIIVLDDDQDPDELEPDDIGR